MEERETRTFSCRHQHSFAFQPNGGRLIKSTLGPQGVTTTVHEKISFQGRTPRKGNQTEMHACGL